MISVESLYRKSRGWPPKASHQISKAHTLSRLTRFTLPSTVPLRYSRRLSSDHFGQSSGTGWSMKSRMMPSLLLTSRWASCSSFASSSSSPVRNRPSPNRQRMTASAQIWSISSSSVSHTSFLRGWTPTSTGQNRRLPVRSRRNIAVLVVPKNTQQRGSSLT